MSFCKAILLLIVVGRAVCLLKHFTCRYGSVRLLGVSVIGGLESWTGVLDWSTGLEYWSTGVLEC